MGRSVSRSSRRRGGQVAFNFDIEKAVAALLCLAADPRVTALDKYKAGKLMFLADKYHVVRYSRPIFGDFYKALPWGPVPQNLLRSVDAVIEGRVNFDHATRIARAIKLDRSYENPRIGPAEQPDRGALSDSDIEALDYVILEHGKKTFDELMALTHHMAAYRKVWEARKRGSKQALMRYEDFFDEDSGAVAGAREEMIENAELRKSFSAF
jgi:uncharacterized phage-associated protein